MDNLIPFSPSQKANAKANVSRFNNELLSRREAAAYLGIAENTLAMAQNQKASSLSINRPLNRIESGLLS